MGFVDLHDLALLYLDGVAAAPPVPLPASDAARPDVGTELTLVGFGAASSGIFGPSPFDRLLRRAGTSAVTDASDSEVRVGDGASPRACVGDSGGPALTEDGTVAGVTSRAWSAEEGCETGGVHTRVDAHAAWLADELEASCEDGRRSCAAPAEGAGTGCMAGSGTLAGLLLGPILGRRRRGGAFGDRALNPHPVAGREGGTARLEGQALPAGAGSNRRQPKPNSRPPWYTAKLASHANAVM